MAAAFDPYRKWLGISPKDQPPNHYRLLGIDLFEDDPDVIANAADRQMTHVRTFQTGRHSQVSQKILNELAAARVCLLDAERKAAYDEELNNAQSTAAAIATPPQVAWGPQTPATPPPDFEKVEVSTGSTASGSDGRLRGLRLGGWGLLALVTVVCIAAVSSALYHAVTDNRVSTPEPSPTAGADPESSHGVAQAASASSDANGRTQGDGSPSLPPDGPAAPVSPEPPPAIAPSSPSTSPNGTFAAGGAPHATNPAGDPPGTPDPATPHPVTPRRTTPEPGDNGIGPPTPAPLEPPPSPEAMRQFADDFADRYKAFMATVTGDQRLGHYYAARQFRDEAPQHAGVPPAWYACQLATADAAAQAGDSHTVCRIVDRIDERFLVDATQLRCDLLPSVVPHGLNKSLVAADLLRAAEAATNALRFDAAEQLLSAAAEHVDRALDAELTAEIQEREADVAALGRRFEEDGYREALETLDTNPFSPEAGFKAGLFLCFDLGDWRRGLPLLAGGDADALETQLAAIETSAEADASDSSPALLRAADGWWDLAEQMADDPLRAANLHRHAAELYWQALADLEGEEAARAANRIERQKAEASPEALPASVYPRLNCRKPAHRVLLTRRRGGTTTSELAVSGGIDYLLRCQDGDRNSPAFGSFRFGPNQTLLPAQGNSPKAFTALALLPLLAVEPGMHGRGDFELRVAAGIAALAKKANWRNPTVVSFYEPHLRSVPSHAFATMALCEASAQRPDPMLKRIAQGAVSFISLTQNEDGGWGARPKTNNRPASESDMVSFGWNVMALYIARRCGVPPRDTTIAQARSYLRSLEVEENGRRAYRAPAISTDEAQVLGYTCQILLDDIRDPAALEARAEQLVRDGPRKDREMMFNYFASWLLANSGRDDLYAAWHRQMQDALASGQTVEGEDAGSWRETASESCGAPMGPAYTTCLALLTLQVHYLYPPIQWDKSP